MQDNNRGIKLGTGIIIMILLIVIVICFNIYKKNYFNGFEKAISEEVASKGRETTEFSRDSKVKYSNDNSYKIENLQYSDAMFYKEIEVEPNTPYKVSCMVKTENVQCEIESETGGVAIGLLETTEYCKPITGTNDWQVMEFMFNSKNRTKVKISFRLGGNDNNCTGKAWFSDFKLEKGTKNTRHEWNIGCFIIKELDVEIENKQYNFKINTTDIENAKINIARFKDDCYNFSDNKMFVNYDINEIDKPITTISYTDEYGYYIAYKDIENEIYDIVKQKEYDHVFVICRMETDTGEESIPIYDNWLGLGSMDMYGIGYSQIRINKNANKYLYKYGAENQAPEEVYVHEFLHTLERNCQELGYDVPALHDYEKYGYTNKTVEGLNDWYKAYMRKKILDLSTGQYMGLNEVVYTTQPPNSGNFKYSIEMEFNKEPQNIFEEILSVLDAFSKK